MSNIKISSSNVYDYELLSTQDNIIKDTNISLKVVTEKDGELLDGEYSQRQTFYKVSGSGDSFSAELAPERFEYYPWKTVKVYGEVPSEYGTYVVEAAEATDTWYLKMDSNKNIFPNVRKMKLLIEENWGVHSILHKKEQPYETQYDFSIREGQYALEYDPNHKRFKWTVAKEVNEGSLENTKNYNFALQTINRSEAFAGKVGDAEVYVTLKKEKYLLDRKFSVLGKYYETSEETFTHSANIVNSDFIEPDIFDLPSNELVQKSNQYSIAGLDFNETFADNVIKRYENGKEVYTLKCSIANYYDTEGNLKIYAGDGVDNDYDVLYPMMFQKYDKVEPYIFTSKGEVPLSKDKNGNPKVFEVIGVDFSYSGVPWQILTVQEYRDIGFI